MNEIEFIVDGQPVGKGRPRVTKNVTYTPKKTRDYENHVIASYIRQCGAHGVHFPKGTPVALTLEAYVEPAKSWSKKKVAEFSGRPHTQKPDLDNVEKIILDGINGFPFSDDCQVSSVTKKKRWCATGQRPHVRVILKKDEGE